MSLALEPPWCLADSVRATVAYADIFDFAVTETEIHRDLIGIVATPAQVATAVRNSILAGDFSRKQGYVTLEGREGLVDRRISQNDATRRLWPRATDIGFALAMLPFVRLVGVTGSLAANNAARDADIDYLLIVSPGRLWFVRALAISIVRIAGVAGIKVCPNYFLTTNALALPNHDIYTAHELLQMVPLNGNEAYVTLRSQNRWADRLMPNRSSQPIAVPSLGSAAAAIKKIGERAFGGSIGSRLDRWESTRKITRFRTDRRNGTFTRDVCEGHFGCHRADTCREWQRRCDRLGVTVPWIGDQPRPAFSVGSTTARGAS